AKSLLILLLLLQNARGGQIPGPFFSVPVGELERFLEIIAKPFGLVLRNLRKVPLCGLRPLKDCLLLGSQIDVRRIGRNLNALAGRVRDPCGAGLRVVERSPRGVLPDHVHGLLLLGSEAIPRALRGCCFPRIGSFRSLLADSTPSPPLTGSIVRRIAPLVIREREDVCPLVSAVETGNIDLSEPE